MTPREISDSVLWPRVLEEIGVDPGRGGRTYCVVHRGNNANAFSYRENTGRAHCFSCGWDGDKIAFLQEVSGSDFKSALSRLAAIAGITLDAYRKPSRADLAHARAHRAALQAAQEAYHIWERQQLIKATDEYRALTAERFKVEKKYRSVMRNAAIVSERILQATEQELAAIYNRIDPLEWDLELFTLNEHQAVRLQWWKEERNNGQLTTR